MKAESNKYTRVKKVSWSRSEGIHRQRDFVNAQPSPRPRDHSGCNWRGIPVPWGPPRGLKGETIAVGDLDNDGSEEIVNLFEPPSLLKNFGPRGNALLVRALTASGRDAIGARITVISGRRKHIEEVRSGGYFISQGDFRVHFGLGPVTKVDVRIRWPGVARRASRMSRPTSGSSHARARESSNDMHLRLRRAPLLSGRRCVPSRSTKPFLTALPVTPYRRLNGLLRWPSTSTVGPSSRQIPS